MLKLRTDVAKGQPIVSDSNIPTNEVDQVRFIKLNPRGDGVGNGFKGRAPNRAVIDMGDKKWRTIVFSDDFDLDQVTGFELYDSTKQSPPLTFKQDTKNSMVFYPDHEARKSNVTTGQERWATLVTDFQQKFAYLGGVGVNDRGHALTVTVEIPADENTRQNRESLETYAKAEAKRFNSDIDLVFKPVGARVPNREPLMAGHLGSPEHPSIAIAGVQQISPQDVGNPNPVKDAGIRPYEATEEGSEKPLQPGQTFETYGSEGPQDQ